MKKDGYYSSGEFAKMADVTPSAITTDRIF